MEYLRRLHFKNYLDYEGSLMTKFQKEPFFDELYKLSNAEFFNCLVQNSKLSEAFVPTYYKAMYGMTKPEDIDAKELLRGILLEEMGVEKEISLPLNLRKGPAHIELLLTDLKNVGIFSQPVLDAQPSETTEKALQKLKGLIPNVGDLHYCLKTMAGLRLYGEVLVGEVYRHYVSELDRRDLLSPKESVFYKPHMEHDNARTEKGDHSHSFEAILEKRVVNKETFNIAKESADKAYEARRCFFDQFVGISRTLATVRNDAAMRLEQAELIAWWLSKVSGIDKTLKALPLQIKIPLLLGEKEEDHELN